MKAPSFSGLSAASAVLNRPAWQEQGSLNIIHKHTVMPELSGKRISGEGKGTVDWRYRNITCVNRTHCRQYNNKQKSVIFLFRFAYFILMEICQRIYCQTGSDTYDAGLSARTG